MLVARLADNAPGASRCATRRATAVAVGCRMCAAHVKLGAALTPAAGARGRVERAGSSRCFFRRLLTMTQVGEGVAVGVVAAAAGPCDHAWEETESKSPEEGKKANSETAAKVKVSDPPSAKGYEFENHCIDANMEKLKISKVSVRYKCSKCAQTQEVDIVGENQIAECKNKKKADLKQAERLRDIQTKTKGGGKPLAKINKSHEKAGSLEKTYGKNGFATEMVAGF
jgi:hypothetical protein